MRTLVTALLALLPTICLADSVNVSCAVSLREGMTDIAAAFKEKTGVDINLNMGASGQLAQQIEAGADCDLFISAANKQVDDLAKKQFTDDSTRFVLARNSLVLIAPSDAKNPPADFQSLASDTVKKLAVGEPKSVPAGQYAMEVLKKLAIADKLSDRIILGANVRQVLDYVKNGEVSAGVVYSTDAKAAGETVKVIATADESWHSPIVYPGVILKGAKNRDAATKFVEFLKSEKAREILRARGFIDAADTGAAPGSTDK